MKILVFETKIYFIWKITHEKLKGIRLISLEICKNLKTITLDHILLLKVNLLWVTVKRGRLEFFERKIALGAIYI